MLRDIAKLTGYRRDSLANLVRAGKIKGRRAEKRHRGGLLPWMTSLEEVRKYREKPLTPSERGRMGGRPPKSSS